MKKAQIDRYYVEVENVPVKLLNRLLIDFRVKEVIEQYIRDNKTQKMKGLKLKHKVTPKKKLTDEQIIGIIMDCLNGEKSDDLYEILVGGTILTVKDVIEEKFDEQFDWESGFIDNVNDLIDILPVPQIITYIRQNHEELHKYIPALLSDWMKSYDFLELGISDIYEFKYEHTFEEEFGVKLNFECLSRKLKIDKTLLEGDLSKQNNPAEYGIEVVVEHLTVLKNYLNNAVLNDGKRAMAYEEVLAEKEKELNELNKQIKAMKKGIELAERIKEEAMLQLEDSEYKIENLHDIIKTKVANVEDLDKKLTLSEKNLKKVKKEMAKMEKEKEQYGETVEKLKSSVAEYKRIIKDKDAEIEKYSNHIKELESLNSDMSVMSIELEKEKRTKYLMENKYKAEIESLKKEIEYLKETNSVKEEVAVTSNSKVDEMEDGLGDDFLGALVNNPVF